MTHPDPHLLSMAQESVWKGNARRKLAEDIAADLVNLCGMKSATEGMVSLGSWSKRELADRIEKHLSGAML